MKKINCFLHISLLLFLVSCGDDDKVSKSTVTLNFSTFTVAKSNILDLIIPKAFAASLTNATFCIKRLRFKTEDDDINETSDNVDFSPGVVTLSSEGSSIGSIILPLGTYKRVEIDMEVDCKDEDPSQTSIAFTNDFGSYSTDDTVTVKWRGTFEANEATETLSLNIQNVITTLSSIDTPGNNDIKNSLEAAGSDSDF